MYKIFQFLPNNIQIGLFSATMSEELEDLAQKIMQNPIKILVKKRTINSSGYLSIFYKY